MTVSTPSLLKPWLRWGKVEVSEEEENYVQIVLFTCQL